MTSLLTGTAAACAVACLGPTTLAHAADPPVHIRFSTGGATPPNEMEAAIFGPALQKTGILQGYGKAYTLGILTASKGTPQTLQLLAANQIDIGTLGFSTIALAAEKQAIRGGFSVIAAQFVDGMPGYASNAYMVLQTSGITSAADLKGKVIGTNQTGSASDIILRAWLTDHGVDLKDVTFVEIGYSAQAAALNSGRIALGTFVEPFEALEQATGKARTLFNTAAATGETVAIAVVGRNDFLRAHPAAVRSFLSDWVTGLDWLIAPANRTAAVQIIAETSGTPAEIVNLFYNVKGKDYYRDPNACPDVQGIQNGIDAMVKVGDLAERVDVAKLVNTTYLPRPC